MSKNTINKTNVFVKKTLIDHRDEAKKPNKAKHKKRIQKITELDEFHRRQ